MVANVRFERLRGWTELCAGLPALAGRSPPASHAAPCLVEVEGHPEKTTSSHVSHRSGTWLHPTRTSRRIKRVQGHFFLATRDIFFGLEPATIAYMNFR
jgi:hypothetical protein